jgi:hypothetical protein
VKLPTRTRIMLAWSLWLATLGCCAGGLLAAVLWFRPLTLELLAGGAARAPVFPLGYATIGLVLTLRRPANPIGWLYAVPAVARRAAAVAPLAAGGGRRRGRDGHVRGRRHPVPGPDQQRPRCDRQPVRAGRSGGRIAMVVTISGLVLYAVSLPAALGCVVLRFRASRGVERQQLRWVAAGAAVAVLVLLPLPGGEWLPSFMTVVGLLCMPVSVAVAVLRYRLWDLDRLISRTVTYVLVTGLLVLPYLLILPGATRLAAGSGLAVAAATLAAAAMFQPLRRRIQDLVDRRFKPAPL